MVARGDLGVELPPEDVPGLQKRIVRACRRAGKPVVVATQMLESMVHSPAPTRAEASDVATAVFDGADAVMLSAETASGDYPEEAVGIMDRIIQRTERDPLYRTLMDAVHSDPEPTAADAISAAARQVAHTVGAACIVSFTNSGSTALRAARERPDARRTRRSSVSPPTSPPPGGWRSPGACIGSTPRTSTTSARWWRRRPRSPAPKASPSRAAAS
jgi:pyruvate kinase